MKHFISLIAALMVAVACMAQSTMLGKYNASSLDMAAGMPNNYADDIFQDSYGFMWISTHGGLVRYNGYEFEDMGFGTPSVRLRSNSCRNVCEDRFHRLWIAFEEGPQVLDLQTMRPATPECADTTAARTFRQVMEGTCLRTYCDTKGNMWIVTDRRLYRIAFDDKGRIRSALATALVSHTPDIAVCDVWRRGTVVACNNGRVYEYYEQGGKIAKRDFTSAFAPLADRYAGSIIGYAGKVWLATNAGLFCSDGRQYHCSPTDRTLQHDVATSLAISPENRLLVGTLCGVDIIDGRTGNVEHWNSASPVNPLTSNFVNSLFAKNGQIWVGTETGGVVKLVPRRLNITYYKNDPGNPATIARNAVNAMYAAPDGTMWVGVVEGGLNCLRPGSKTFAHFTTANSGLPHNSVSALAADGRGCLWIGTWGGGVAVMSLSQPGKIWPLKADTRILPNLTFIGALAYDRINDGVWIGANEGLFFYNLAKGQLEEPFRECREIRGCIGSLVAKDGHLYMGCLPGMVVVDLKSRPSGKGFFRMKRLLYKLDAPESRTFEKIVSFCQTRDGRIWMGSNGYGMYCVSRSKGGKAQVKAYTTNDGLCNNAVMGIVEDRRGQLWIATGNGLSVFNPKTGQFDNYSEADGLMCPLFYYNGATAGLSGDIYLGTDMGMMAVSPASEPQDEGGKLRFTALYVDNQPILAGSPYIKKDISIARKIYLHESDRSFAVYFSALNFAGEKQGAYSYCMEGYEDEWVTLPPGQHSVRYSTLPPGNYKFKVRYTPSVGSQKVLSADIDVSVSPYFWKSWWFVSLVLIGAAAALRYAYMRRIETMRDRAVKSLYRPIEEALKESDEPGQLQSRIQSILENQKRYKESQKKTIEADRQMTRENERPFMEEVMAAMEANFGNSKFGVQELADAVGLNRTTLSKRLNAETGLPTSQFIRNYRLDIARRMLAENEANRNIMEIAYRVGFNDPKYFTRCFTKLYGVAPSAYKDETAQKEEEQEE